MLLLALLACGSPGPCPEGSRPQPIQEGRATLLTCIDPAGALHGPRRRMLDGVLLWEDHWEHGVQVGRRDLYQGALRVQETTWADGRRHGPALGRHPSGELMYQGRFEADLATGRWSFYRSDDPVPAATLAFTAGRPTAIGRAAADTPLQPVELALAGEVLVGLRAADGELAVGERRLRGELPGEIDPQGAVRPAAEAPCAALDRAELLVWPGEERLVAHRLCGPAGCTRWALQPGFASAGARIPAGCALGVTGSPP